MDRWKRRVLCAALLITAPATRAIAQDTSDVSPYGWMWAVSAGVPGWRTEVFPQAFTFGMNVTDLNPNGVGGDFAVQFAPYALFYGALAVAARGGFGFPYRVGRNAFLIPSVGGTALVAATGVGGGALVGGNAGLAIALGPRRARTGLRLGVTWHLLEDLDEPLWLIEIGAASMPSGGR
jgi:hypothetical protein